MNKRKEITHTIQYSTLHAIHKKYFYRNIIRNRHFAVWIQKKKRIKTYSSSNAKEHETNVQ